MTLADGYCVTPLVGSVALKRSSFTGCGFFLRADLLLSNSKRRDEALRKLYVADQNSCVVEIKQRHQHNAKFVTAVTRIREYVLVLRQCCAMKALLIAFVLSPEMHSVYEVAYDVSGNCVVYFTRLKTKVELAERTAGCLRI